MWFFYLPAVFEGITEETSSCILPKRITETRTCNPENATFPPILITGPGIQPLRPPSARQDMQSHHRKEPGLHLMVAGQQ